MLKTIKNLLGIDRPKDISHPFFGTLSFVKNKYDNQCFWCGDVIFEGLQIALKIHSDDMPTEEHISFFTKIMNNLEALVEESSRFVKSSFEIWKNKTYPESFFDEFKCVSLQLPLGGNAANDWQITFARRSDLCFVFTIYIVDNKVESTNLD